MHHTETWRMQTVSTIKVCRTRTSSSKWTNMHEFIIGCLCGTPNVTEWLGDVRCSKCGDTSIKANVMSLSESTAHLDLPRTLHQEWLLVWKCHWTRQDYNPLLERKFPWWRWRGSTEKCTCYFWEWISFYISGFIISRNSHFYTKSCSRFLHLQRENRWHHYTCTWCM